MASAPDATGSSHRRRFWLFALALWLVTLLAYQPAWHGGVLWDDDVHLTRAELQSADGLRRIWTDLRATPQYYPVAHSAFWIQQQLWGDDTLGYHIVNISLHALSAVLFALILRRLAVPGALFAALIFALHPVHVESVAWMSELKNTLSGVLYLSAALVYLRYDQERRPRWYLASLAVFALALLSKSVTASLPGALLVVCWWKRGGIDWRRDVAPLVPFFVAGAAAGLATVWIERNVIGAQGSEFSLTAIERVLIAGRAILFYLSALLWPANLIFIYPRWNVSQQVIWQYLYPLGAAALVTWAWWLRSRSRAPLAALLFFFVTLFPALGFFDVYPFRYSFVADHFQYLASLGIIALVAGAAARLAGQWRMTPLTVGLIAVVVVLPLALLTRSQSRQYVNAETLYRAILSRDPGSWMAHDNLGELLLAPPRGTAADVQEAIEHFRASVAARPGSADAHNNLGLAWQRQGRFEDARQEHETAIRLDPTLAAAHHNLGIDLERLGRPLEAIPHYARAITIDPGFAGARHNLGAVLQQTGRAQEAVEVLAEGTRIAPDVPELRVGLGMALQRLGRVDEASVQFREALRLKPDSSDARNNLGVVLVAQGRYDEAIREYQAAARLDPGVAMVHANMGFALMKLGRVDDAIAAYRQALAREARPGTPQTLYQLGVALAQGRRLEEAELALAEAVRLKPDFVEARSSLAAVQAARRTRR